MHITLRGWQIDPAGLFVYAPNRAPAAPSIAVFAVDPSTGRLVKKIRDLP